MFRIVLFSISFVGISLFLIYGIWLTRQMGKISRGIGAITLRTYQKLPEKGIFNGIYAALNQMDAEIRHSLISSKTKRSVRDKNGLPISLTT